MLPFVFEVLWKESSSIILETKINLWSLNLNDLRWCSFNPISSKHDFSNQIEKNLSNWSFASCEFNQGVVWNLLHHFSIIHKRSHPNEDICNDQGFYFCQWLKLTIVLNFLKQKIDHLSTYLSELLFILFLFCQFRFDFLWILLLILINNLLNILW